MHRRSASDFDQELLDLFDRYVHGQIGRRDFLQGASKYAVGGLTVGTILESLAPNYAWAEQVAGDDSRIRASYETYSSPQGSGTMRGYLARPAEAGETKLPGILVVHENRGLNPYIEDVVRRAAVAGYVAFGPDALTPLGGYPGNDDDGRILQSKLEPEKITEDFMAAARWLQSRPDCDGKVGVVGFCFGGGMANTLAVRMPEVIAAAVPFYGSQPAVEDVPKIKGALLIHYAELDQRINEGAAAYDEALAAAGVEHTVHYYPGVNHGFHNDTTPRYDEAAAKLAWERTVAFFDAKLK